MNVKKRRGKRIHEVMRYWSNPKFQYGNTRCYYNWNTTIDTLTDEPVTCKRCLREGK